jgi:hypothetical protein
MGIIEPYGSKGPYAKAPLSAGPEVRLVVCATCETVEPIPDYAGPPSQAAERDTVLNRILEKHRTGVERLPHVGQMFRVKEADWNNMEVRPQIMEQIIAKFNPDSETGLGAEAYALRDNFRDDAMACWQKHLRTPACPDYKTDPYLLTPDTAAERKEAGIDKFDPLNPATQRWLCEYCPVHSLVEQARREKMGLYG